MKCVAFCSIEILPCFFPLGFFLPHVCFFVLELASEACLKKAFEDLDKEVLRNQPPGLGEVVAQTPPLAPKLTAVAPVEVGSSSHYLRGLYIYIYPRVVQIFFHQQ